MGPHKSLCIYRTYLSIQLYVIEWAYYDATLLIVLLINSLTTLARCWSPG